MIVHEFNNPRNFEICWNYVYTVHATEYLWNDSMNSYYNIM